MFFVPIVVLSLVGSTLAGPYKKFDGLNVKIHTPEESVRSVDDIVLHATVTNSGAESVKILKYGTVLDSQLPTKSFMVTKDGEAVAFTGMKLSVSLNQVDDAAFTLIPAGESVMVTHKVASMYDFAAAGSGKYMFEPMTTFLVKDATKHMPTSELTMVKILASPVEVEISGDMASRELPLPNKRAVDICTDSSKKSFIDASYTEGKALASSAVSYIASNGASDAFYQAYFGANPTSRVTSVFNAVANENSTSRTLSCVDTYGICGNGGVIAYTVVSTTNIYFCPIFFDEVSTPNLCTGTSVASRNIRGGTTLHEMTHAVAGTDDVTYGCAADQDLSDANAVINADSYNCFATQIYAITQC